MSYDHGVVYSPNKSGTPTTTLQDLRNDGVSYVRVYWVDLGNVRRCRVLPIQYFSDLVQSNRPGVNVASVGVGLVYLMMPEGFSGVGEYLYVIDMRSLRILHGVGAKPVGAVLGRFEQKDVARLGREVKWDPRTALTKAVDLAESAGIEFLVGFESEFILLKSTDPVVPSNVHQWSGTTAMLNGSAEAAILEEIADALRDSHIQLQMYHAEAAPGQYEIVTGPADALAAVDALIYTREIIVNVAAKHGLHATFAPRPFMYSAGSSTHAHLSVHSSLQKSAEMTAHEQSFLAGILDHLPAIAAFTLPTPASYKRVGDGVWSGGTYVSYGTENREAPVRLTNATSPLSRNFELRFIDGTANPYFALAAIIAAGMNGIEAKQAPQMSDCGTKSAAEMTEAERQEIGIKKRMPLTVEDARDNLKADEVLVDVLGKELVEKYLAVNKTLGDALTQDETEELN
ncbi:hypothetical protein CPB85DRAFT_1254865 [Mucidula mucida]|nr:hypothetical protein CPB85DRAFT_1254865 [Mucidula mucida]